MPDASIGADGLRERYGALRRLAADLAGAVTVREVCTVIERKAGAALGARTALVTFSEPQSGRMLKFDQSVIARNDDRWVEALPDAPSWFAEALGTGARLELSDPAAVAAALPSTDPASTRVVVYPTLSEPGLPATAIAFVWDVSATPAEDEDVAAVVALCSAAVRRAWTTRRARHLGAIADALIRTAPVGFAVLDPDLRYLQINDILAGFAGKSAEAHIGRRLRDMVPRFADDAESVLRDVIRTSRPTDWVEVPWVSPSGSGTADTWRVRCFPVTDGSETTIGVGVIVEDVTESRRTREELERLYDRERAIAARLQVGLQPDRIVAPDGYDVAARYVPGTDDLRLGGDWHDLFHLGPDRMAIVVGDAVGHGIEAALSMVRIRHALSGLSHAVAEPGAALDRLDDVVATEHDRYIATLFYGILEPSTGRVTFTSAGHPPPLVVSPGGTVAAVDEARSTPLGINGPARPSADFVLRPGDTLVVYTDGLYEQRSDSAGEGMSRLVAAARREVGDVEAFADHLLDAAAGADRRDDIALLVLHRRET